MTTTRSQTMSTDMPDLNRFEVVWNNTNNRYVLKYQTLLQHSGEVYDVTADLESAEPVDALREAAAYLKGIRDNLRRCGSRPKLKEAK